MNDQRLRDALGDWDTAEDDSFAEIPMEEVARDLVAAVSAFIREQDELRVEDKASGVVYLPVVHPKNGMVGYRCQHRDGRETFIYFNPSDSSDDGVPNVFVYEGEHFDPAQDAPSHHYVIEWPEQAEEEPTT